VESNFIEGGNENVAFERARGREGERERVISLISRIVYVLHVTKC
jgi:hypothetical protein